MILLIYPIASHNGKGGSISVFSFVGYSWQIFLTGYFFPALPMFYCNYLQKGKSLYSSGDFLAGNKIFCNIVK
jgi:hypothetical protein